MMMLVAVLLVSCSKQKGAALVPEDAMVVMRFDVTKLQQKCGIEDKNSDVKKWIKEQIKDMDVDKELRNKLLDIVDDPTASGIDLTEPVYFYVSGNLKRNFDGGLVGSMASESDLTSLLEAAMEESGGDASLEEQDGVKYIEANGTVMVYNGDWFYLGSAGKDVDDLIEQLKDRASGKGSIVGNKAFEQMCKKDGVFQMLFQGAGMENLPDMDKVADMMPDGLELKDMTALVDFVLDEGEAVMTSEVIALSDEWQDYIDKWSDAMKPISKEQTKYISDKALSLFINIDAKEIYSYIKQMAKLYNIDKEALSQIKDVCDMLDGTLSFDGYGIGNNGPLFTVYVGTKNNEAYQMVKQVMADDENTDTDDADKCMIPTDYDYDWDTGEVTPSSWGELGFKNGQTYFSMDADNAFSTPEKKYPVSEIKGDGFYARFNFGCFKDYLDQFSGSEREVMEALGKMFDYAEAYSEVGGKSVLRITTKDKDKTPVEVITKYVKKYLN